MFSIDKKLKNNNNLNDALININGTKLINW